MEGPRGGYGGASYETLTLAWERSVGSFIKIVSVEMEQGEESQ